MKYSIKFVEKELDWKRQKKLSEGRLEKKRVNDWEKRLQEHLQKGQYDWIIDDYHWGVRSYSELATSYLELDIDVDKMKKYKCIAAQISLFLYELLEKGFTKNYNGDIDFVALNLHLTKNAILANEYEMALQLATENTIEGALILGDYERAKTILPDNPEDITIQNDEMKQCMWAITYQDQKLFDKYIAKRIRELRKDAPYGATIIDTFGLALVKLAYRRGLRCNLKVMELPLDLLDDTRIESVPFDIPFKAEVLALNR